MLKFHECGNVFGRDNEIVTLSEPVAAAPHDVDVVLKISEKCCKLFSRGVIFFTPALVVIG